MPREYLSKRYGMACTVCIRVFILMLLDWYTWCVNSSIMRRNGKQAQHDVHSYLWTTGCLQMLFITFSPNYANHIVAFNMCCHDCLCVDGIFGMLYFKWDILIQQPCLLYTTFEQSVLVSRKVTANNRPLIPTFWKSGRVFELHVYLARPAAPHTDGFWLMLNRKPWANIWASWTTTEPTDFRNRNKHNYVRYSTCI